MNCEWNPLLRVEQRATAQIEPRCGLCCCTCELVNEGQDLCIFQRKWDIFLPCTLERILILQWRPRPCEPPFDLSLRQTRHTLHTATDNSYRLVSLMMNRGCVNKLGTWSWDRGVLYRGGRSPSIVNQISCRCRWIYDLHQWRALTVSIL